MGGFNCFCAFEKGGVLGCTGKMGDGRIERGDGLMSGLFIACPVSSSSPACCNTSRVCPRRDQLDKSVLRAHEIRGAVETMGMVNGRMNEGNWARDEKNSFLLLLSCVSAYPMPSVAVLLLMP